MATRIDKIIYGKEPLNVPTDCVGVQIYKSLIFNEKRTKPALFNINSRQKLLYSELLRLSVKCARYLKNLNIGKNDFVGIFSENNNNYFVPLIASIYLGAVPVLINHQYGESDTLHALNLAKPKILFCSETTNRIIYTLMNDRRTLRRISVILLENIKKSLIKVDVDHLTYKPEVCPLNDTAVIVYSSGTTGLMKGVMLTHKNINLRLSHATDSRYLFANQDPTLYFQPFYHVYGLMCSLFHLLSGITLNYMSKFDFQLYLKAIEELGIVYLPVVPPILKQIDSRPEVSKYDLSSVKYIMCGAAILPKELQESSEKKFPNAIIRQVYGMTETTFACTMYPVDGEPKSGSCGVPGPGVQLKICDPSSEVTLGPNELGEVYLKSDMNMKGYLDNPKNTEDIYRDSWIRSGDIGYLDEDNYLFIVDRLKELIKVKGFQVPPAELEALLLEHPLVIDAGVIGIPDTKSGEVPLAFVVKNAEVTEEELMRYVNSLVAPFKHIREIRFIDEIPKAPSGKILRRELRNLV